MATTQPTRNRIQALKKAYDTLRPGKESLLSMIDEVEVPESVYNSNAIENSTLTLKETERILLEQMLSRNVSVREAFEAKKSGSRYGIQAGQDQRQRIEQEPDTSLASDAHRRH